MAEVSSATSIDVEELRVSSSASDIVRTDRAQLATFTLSLVGWHYFCEQHGTPRFVLGHSLGEFSALVASGVLSLQDGARLVAVRGDAMKRAAQSQDGTMVALMGPSDTAMDNLAAVSDVWIANVNGPGQIVVSGTTKSIENLIGTAKGLGWKRATALNVGGAFHSPLMSPAQNDLDAVLAVTTFHETNFTLIDNVRAQLRHGGPEWSDLLSRQLTSPVQYLSMINALPDSVTHAVEMPPSGILAGLTKRIRDFASIDSLASPSEK